MDRRGDNVKITFMFPMPDPPDLPEEDVITDEEIADLEAILVDNGVEE